MTSNTQISAYLLKNCVKRSLEYNNCFSIMKKQMDPSTKIEQKIKAKIINYWVDDGYTWSTVRCVDYCGTLACGVG